ncbi:subtilisin-like protease SBT3.5 isoform X1 [Olea europaea var. sylvestris]|uniref:subtilisin-like protease SBT3.5 isoform X1 n=2 Tax=Olea europaea var. sylvestris TaxID=158386 RepID=UPI000C1D1F82|nr:subtilisin-like protease SBT3.5 isoform X1 [Olea europaea var. sylvestris]
MSFLSTYLIFIALIFANVTDILLTRANLETTQVHIVYMGEKQHDDVELITSNHHDLLSSVLGSRGASAESMIYSYRHGFSGFAAKLTESQARSISEIPGVVQVIPNHFYKVQTTRSWAYLGLSSSSPSNLLHETKLGEDVIIGVLDTGVWPESKSFNDEGIGPIPSRWKGFCQKGERFDPAKNCNKKLIGARFFFDGLQAALGEPFNSSKYNEYLSARDAVGHGTHTASTAGGSFVHNVCVRGLAYGTARGGAPHARLAMYKVVWNGLGTAADILKAFDEAIHDRVDVLSLSLGLTIPLYPEIDNRDLIYYGSFHAVANGITVVCSAGNSGPVAQTVLNVAPWVITVGASTIDRSFPTPIILGNNKTLMGQAMFFGKNTGFVGLIYKERAVFELPHRCESLSLNDTWVAGKVVLCFTLTYGQALSPALSNVLMAGGLGMIVASNPTRYLFEYAGMPFIFVNYNIGTQILDYFRSNRDPKVRLIASKTYIGKHAPTYVASFSSRGPNSLSPAILKPDVVAPGADILAAYTPGQGAENGYKFLSGTSMAAPHVSGIVALLKSLHPDWSPAAIKSALVTTAWTADTYSGEPILAEGDITRIADPFDFGGGLVNPNRARDPGLVYELGIEDYIQYLCSMGYDEIAINHLTQKAKSCPRMTTSVMDLNLPSITIPNLNNPVNLTRTVTNVGAISSEYKAIIKPPPGVSVVVKPDYLIFSPKIKKISFTVTISTTHQVTTKYYFGSLTWTDGLHKVRIPLSVRSEFSELVW